MRDCLTVPFFMVYNNRYALQVFLMEETVVLRLTFRPDSVSDFLFEDDVIAGQLVVERGDYTLEEAYDFIREFSSCLIEAQILIDGSRVVNLSDFVDDPA